MKRTTFALSCSIFFSALHSQSWQWAKATIPEGMSTGKAITTDLSGNVFVAYDGISASPPNYMNAYMCNGSEGILAKHSASGQLLWSRGIGARGVNAITTDKYGNVFVTGVAVNTGVFCDAPPNQGITLNGSPGMEETFVAKYDWAGNLQWAKLFQVANNTSSASDIKADGAGNVYVPVYYGPPTQNNGGFFTLVKYDAQGMVVWQTQPVFRLWTKAIDVDESGNSYITGFFGDTATLGNTLLTGTASTNAFVSKIGSGGNVVWAKSEGTSYGEGTGISLDKQGSLYVSGWFVGQSNFGAATLYGCNMQPVACTFLLKYSDSGTSLWAKEVNVRWSHIAADSLGCYLGAANELMVMKYDASGALQWTVSPSGQNGYPNWMTSITTDGKQNCYFTGYLYENTTFGSTTLVKSPQMGSFGYMAKLAGPSVPVSITVNTRMQGIEIYPNPASDKLTLALPEPAVVSISDILGQVIGRYELSQGEVQLEIGNFTPGIYTLRSNSSPHKSIKFLKQ